MADMSPADRQALVQALARHLSEHKGENVVALDLSRMSSWTDFFVIATSASSTHLQALARHVKEFVAERGLDDYRPSSSTGSDDEWLLVDCSWFVVHLMSRKSREFYDLEKLWFEAKRLEP